MVNVKRSGYWGIKSHHCLGNCSGNYGVVGLEIKLLVRCPDRIKMSYVDDLEGVVPVARLGG